MRHDELPIYRHRDRILQAVAANQVVVVESPTGSGKTTQLPIILHQAGYAESGVLGITQPRRIAALSVSDYISRQLEGESRSIVGYKMRFEDHTDEHTRIKVMTDGILLQELKADPMLSRYSIIVVDEAHERSLNIDFVLGLLKRILAARKNFKVLVSSATINAEVFSEYFDECPIVRIDAEIYPIRIEYSPPEPSSGADGVVDKAVEICRRLVGSGSDGDILIFLTGEQTIKNCISALYSLPESRRMVLLPLYGRLSKEEQERVFDETPRGKVKIVVSTNIAETSVTIDGITAVIDSGLAKINRYNPRTFTSSLLENPISKASCNQRRGRAGRTAPGVCYRLYSKEDYEARPLFETEEIFRTDLSEVVLRMAELEISDFENFDFLSPPQRQGIAGAVETLRLLEALTDDRRLTPVGVMMAAFPLLPRHSRVIVEAVHSYPDVVEESVIAAAFLSANTPFLLPQGEELEARRAHHRFRDPYGDFVSYIRLYRAFVKSRNKSGFCETSYLDERVMHEIANIKLQLEEIVSSLGVPIGSGGAVKDYLCAVARGLVQFVCARMRPGVYRSLTTDRIHIHPGSVMFRENPDFIVAGEIVRTTRMFARSVSPLRKEWLTAVSPVLIDELFGGRRREKPEKGKENKSARKDTTWQVQLGAETFRLEPYRGKKKIAVLPWERIREISGTVDVRSLSRFKGLRAKVVYGKYEILVGCKLPTVLRLVPLIEPDKRILATPTVQRNLDSSSPEDIEELCGHLEEVLALCSRKKSSRSLGFIALHSEDGHFWYACSKGFTHALTESISSVEELIDLLGRHGKQELVRSVQETYRRLSSLLED